MVCGIAELAQFLITDRFNKELQPQDALCRLDGVGVLRGAKNFPMKAAFECMRIWSLSCLRFDTNLAS
jgi:hypothetical protein